MIHLVPHAGGIVWGGSAVCGSQKCLNVLVAFGFLERSVALAVDLLEDAA